MSDTNKTGRLESGMQRRHFLAGTGGLAMLLSTAASPAVAQSSEPTKGLPAAWDQAPAIPLWPHGTPEGGFTRTPMPMQNPPATFLHNVEMPYLRVFRPEKSNGRALLAIPGGSYIFVSIQNEGVDIARDMTARGYTVFVLVYRLPGEGWTNRSDVPLQDAQRAMRIVRSRAGEYGFDPARIASVGFSAGGHLAASLATDFAQSVYAPRDAIDRLDARPFITGLIYPVISMSWPITHYDSRQRLLGDKPDDALVARRSPAAHVGPDTPPLFLACALDDGAVPPENSMEMMAAMRRAQRPVEGHFFEEGGHGFGLSWPGMPARAWPTLFADFVDRHVAKAG